MSDSNRNPMDRPRGSYEGYIKYAAGEVVSLQCFEGNCSECPDGHDDESVDRAVTLADGLYCEHGCTGVSAPQDDNGNADRAALNKIQYMLRDPDWGVGMLEDIGEIIVGTGRSINALVGEDGYDISTWGRH